MVASRLFEYTTQTRILLQACRSTLGMAIAVGLTGLALGCSHSGGGSNSPEGGDDGRVHNTGVPNRLQFASSVDRRQGEQIDTVLTYLYQSPIPADWRGLDQMLSLMGLADASPKSLQDWFEDRVAYVVDENFDVEQHIKRVPGTFNYPNPDEFPPEWTDAQPMISATISADVSAAGERAVASTAATSKAQVVMVNLSGGVYLYGKELGSLMEVDIDGIGPVRVTSPRVGILKIGPGMFSLYQGSSAETNKIFQASTLFHEARHSDGNGTSTSFAHVICPVGHTYQGLLACDRAANGAYTVGATVQRALMESCTNCDESSISELQAMYLDASTRVLSGEVTLPYKKPVTYDAEPIDYDASPEGQR